jgi:hypothetical protein
MIITTAIPIFLGVSMPLSLGPRFSARLANEGRENQAVKPSLQSPLSLVTVLQKPKGPLSWREREKTHPT